jgi:hypothetical protein
MKPRYFLGALAVALGIIWIVGITHTLITDVFSVNLQNPAAWADQIYLPSSVFSTLLFLGFLLAWIYYTFSSRFKRCLDAKQTFGLWTLLFAMSVLSNIICLVLFIQFTVVQAPASQNAIGGGTFVDIPPYFELIPLTFVNGLLLFWLPSCFLSQQTLRFIPPFSYELNSLTEQR